MMKLYNILYDLILEQGANCSNINLFCDFVTKKYRHININDYNQLQEIFFNIKKDFNIDNEKKITKDLALYKVIYDDLNKFYLNREFTDSNKKIITDLYKYSTSIVKVLSSLNLDICDDDIKIYIVDCYPVPFDSLTGVAIAPDLYDFEKYGIPMGIYLKTNLLSNYQSKLTLAHEILHISVAKKNPELLARGLEEGICELLGSLYCTAKLINNQVAINYLKHRRFKYTNNSQTSKLYTDYLKMAYLLYLKVGINGMISIINQGRKKLKEVENLISNNELNKINVVKKPQYDEILDTLASYIILGIPENEVVSPLSYYIIKNYSNENSIDDVIKKLNLEFKDGTECIKEIQNRIFGWIISDNQINLQDINTIKNNNTLRYEI